MFRADVVCLGEAMIELSLDDKTPESAAIGFAGDTLNTAIYLQRSAPRLRIAYATKLGRDRLSDRMVAMMESEALVSDLVLRHPERLPGIYAISTDSDGERTFQYWRDRSAARAMFDAPGLPFDDLGRAGMIYYSAITLAILPDEARARFLDWLEEYRENGGRVAFDSNYRPRLWADAATAQRDVEAAWRRCDVGLPSVDDEMALFQDVGEDAVIRRLGDWGVVSGALKRGASGPRPLDGSPAPAFAPVGKVVDSTAAGDSFNGGYLAARLVGMDEIDCLKAGHALASRVIGARGAILPREIEVAI